MRSAELGKRGDAMSNIFNEKREIKSPKLYQAMMVTREDFYLHTKYSSEVSFTYSDKIKKLVKKDALEYIANSSFNVE